MRKHRRRSEFETTTTLDSGHRAAGDHQVEQPCGGERQPGDVVASRGHRLLSTSSTAATSWTGVDMDQPPLSNAERLAITRDILRGNSAPDDALQPSYRLVAERLLPITTGFRSIGLTLGLLMLPLLIAGLLVNGPPWITFAGGVLEFAFFGFALQGAIFRRRVRRVRK
jgi:hypothetical protein